MTRTRTVGGALLTAAVMLTGALVPGTATAAGASTPRDFRVVASGLDRPRGLAFTPDGTLYATTVGYGPAGRATSANCNDEGCFGGTGRISRIADGKATPVVRYLLSMRGKPDGGFSIGADSLATLPDGRLVTAITAEFAGETGLPPAQVPAVYRPQMGHLIVAPAGGGPFSIGPDVAALEFAHDSDGQGKVSNPYGVATVGNTVYVSDSAANTLVEIKDGIARTIAVFPQVAPLTDSVPDALAAGPDGALYVGEFTGGRPGKTGRASVYKIVPGRAPVVVATGLHNLTGIAVSKTGNIYVSEFLRGEVVRISPDGDRFVAARGLRYPAGLAINPVSGAVYVANHSILPGRRRPGDLGPTGDRGLYGQVVVLK